MSNLLDLSDYDVSNPFHTKGYISKKYFCNRNEETKRLASALANGRNTTLISNRKYGKTGLIAHLFNQNPEVLSCYVDVFSTNSAKEFTNILGSALLSAIETKPDKLMRLVKSLVLGIRPSFSYDSYSGVPKVDLNVQTDKQAFSSLEAIFRWITDQNQKIWLAIDEFQQVTQYEQPGFEARLRSILQFCQHASVVFSGSNRHLLWPIFTDGTRPFYSSTDMMELGPIENQDYLPFIEGHFREGKMQWEPEIIEEWLARTRTHTYYVQVCMNMLFGMKPKRWKPIDFEIAFENILKHQENQYIVLRNILPANHWNFLEALAAEGTLAQPSSSEFLTRYALGAASSNRHILGKLEMQELVIKENDLYRLADPLFEQWFRRRYSRNKPRFQR